MGRQERFLEVLKELGGSAGNGRLRDELGWQDETYERARDALVEDGLITKGRGRGGSVTLALLDEAFEGIGAAVQTTRAGLSTSNELIKAAVGAVIHSASSELQAERLGDLCDIYQPKTISTAEMDDAAAYPVFGANGQIGRYHAYNHEEPQLLVTCRGATCGSVNVSLPRSWITGNAMVVRPHSDRLSSRFLRRLFEYGLNFQSVITGSAQPQITRQSLAPSIIEFPSRVSEQESVANAIEQLVDAVQAQQDVLNRKLAALSELKQSLLARAFSGELTREPLAA